MVSTFFGCKSTNYLLFNCKILHKKVYFDNLFLILFNVFQTLTAYIYGLSVRLFMNLQPIMPSIKEISCEMSGISPMFIVKSFMMASWCNSFSLRGLTAPFFQILYGINSK